MGSFSLMHWLIVLVIVALVFGPSRLGQLGQGLGEGIRNLKKGLQDPPDTAAKPAESPKKSDA
jgi:sec-independent protein translocase protein TatA